MDQFNMTFKKMKIDEQSNVHLKVYSNPYNSVCEGKQNVLP